MESIVKNYKIIFLILGISLLLFPYSKIYSQNFNEGDRTKNNIVEQATKEIEKAKNLKVKTRLRYAAFYNSQGKLPAKKTLTEKVTFDKNGFRKEVIRYTSLGKIDLKYSFKFDSKGRILKMEVRSGSNQLVGKRESVYDKNGNEIQRNLLDVEHGGPSKMIFTYDKENNLIETKNYNNKNEVINIFKNIWEKGKLINSSIVDNNGKTIVKTHFVYDDNGKIIKEEVSESANYSITYKYDSKGNLIEVTNPQTKRIMTYNQNNDLVEDKLYSNDGARQYRITFSYLKNGLQDEETRYDNSDRPAFNGKYVYEFYK